MAVSTRQPIVCFAGDDYWTANPHSRFHFTHALHRRGHPILWVNSIGMFLPKLSNRGFLRRVTGKLGSWSRFLRQIEPGFHVMSPIALPLFDRPRLARMSDASIERQVRWVYRRLGIRDPLVFASVPSFAEVIQRLPRQGMMYYYSDKYDAHRDLGARDEIRRRDRILFEAADAVFCVSREIHASLAHQRPHVHYLPHAVDVRRFTAALEDDAPEPADLAAIPHPRIGYYGSLDDGADRSMILHAARALPDHHFVLIGRVLTDLSALAALPNVHLLGKKPYAEIPYYGKGFDLGFMLFEQNEWIYNCSPLKTKEYLALGLPVVSCPVREIELELADVVSTVTTGDAFVAAVRRELAADNPAARQRRRERVREDTWDARVEEMLAAYEDARRQTSQSPA